MPDWMQRITLVLNMHGMHWTGYIFNTYADMLAILQWVDRRIRGERVLVYLPAWDGRYYWNYPEYRPDERMGGVQGLKHSRRPAEAAPECMKRVSPGMKYRTKTIPACRS